MDSDTLLTASKYVNNLLITRGLLRNGKEIRFEKPDRDTRAHTINLIHDLLLRRDKDHELREQSALTIHSLRSKLTKRDNELRHLRDEMTSKDRRIQQARSETCNAVAEAKRLDQSNKALQEQIQKLKSTMAHIKSQCAADLKKREVEMERLRSHLQGQQRGNRAQVIAPSMTISGGSGVSLRPAARPLDASIRDLDDPEYSLKQETNDFLTRLSAGLSDENDGLISLVQDSLADLKGLLNIDGPATSTTTTTARTQTTEKVLSDTESLTQEMNTVRKALRNLLTSPSFVAVEEVESRDEEIARLRDGWEMMESRWQDVLGMMGGWKRKMERSGDTIDLNDLRQGLGLSADLESIVQSFSPERRRQQQQQQQQQQQSDPGMDKSIAEVLDTTREPDCRAPSKDSAIGGLSVAPNVSKPPIECERPDSQLPVRSSVGTARSTRSTRSSRRTASPIEVSASDDKENPEYAEGDKPPQLLPSPSYETTDQVSITSRSSATAPSPERPDLSILEKLKVAQKEADAVMRSPPEGSPAGSPEDQQGFDAVNDSLVLLRSGKKSTVKTRSKKRKSTLSPEELDSLLGV